MIVYVGVFIRVGTECPSFLLMRGDIKPRLALGTSGVIGAGDTAFRAALF